MIRSSLVLLSAAVFFGTRTASAIDLIDDELSNKILQAQELEESEARSLRVDADGSLGSKCGLFTTKCNTGFECFHNRCIPNRDCLKERLEEFDETFDSEAYKRQMFSETGVSEADLVVAYRNSKGDQTAFVESNTMQSLIHYMQRNMEPFEPVTEIVDSCAGIVSTRRRLKVVDMADADVDRVATTTEEDAEEEETMMIDTQQQQRRRYLAGGYYGPKPSASPSLQPSGSPSLSVAPSVSNAPSQSPSVSVAPSVSKAPSRSPSSRPSTSPSRRPSYQPSPYPTKSPSAHPTMTPRDSTTYLGIHLEGGLGLELSLTAAWATAGKATSDTHVRGCFGPTFGGGIELSFYVATAFDGLDDGWACGSMLFDTDVGFGLNLGMGLGTCFVGSESTYLEYTIGAGVGAGFGIKLCGAQTLPSMSRATDTVFARLEYMFKYGTDVWAPTTKELKGIIAETERFYRDVFAIAYPQSFQSFRMTHVKDTFIEHNKFPVVLDFQPVVVFRISRRRRVLTEEEDDETRKKNSKDDPNLPPLILPSAKDVLKVMKWANYNRYVKEYATKANPPHGLFSNTKKVEFKGSQWMLNSVSDDHHPSYSDDDDDDDDHGHYPSDDDDDHHYPSDDDDDDHGHYSDDDDDHHHSDDDDDDDDDYYSDDDDDDDDDDDYYHRHSEDCPDLLCGFKF